MVKPIILADDVADDLDLGPSLQREAWVVRYMGFGDRSLWIRTVIEGEASSTFLSEPRPQIVISASREELEELWLASITDYRRTSAHDYAVVPFSSLPEGHQAAIREIHPYFKEESDGEADHPG